MYFLKPTLTFACWFNYIQIRDMTVDLLFIYVSRISLLQQDWKGRVTAPNNPMKNCKTNAINRHYSLHFNRNILIHQFRTVVIFEFKNARKRNSLWNIISWHFLLIFSLFSTEIVELVVRIKAVRDIKIGRKDTNMYSLY